MNTHLLFDSKSSNFYFLRHLFTTEFGDGMFWERLTWYLSAKLWDGFDSCLCWRLKILWTAQMFFEGRTSQSSSSPSVKRISFQKLTWAFGFASFYIPYTGEVLNSERNTVFGRDILLWERNIVTAKPSPWWWSSICEAGSLKIISKEMWGVGISVLIMIAILS